MPYIKDRSSYHPRLPPLVWLTLCLLLTSCGGGGGGGSDNPSESPATSSVNPGLSGNLYFTLYDANFIKLDLSTGIGTLLVDKVQSSGGATVADVDQEYVVAKEIFSNFEFSIQVQISSIQGELTNEFVLPGMYAISYEPTLSPDGSVIALKWDPERTNSHKRLSLFDRNGTELKYFEENILRDDDWNFYNHIFSYEWLADGRLLIGENDSIYIVDPFQGTGTKKLLKRFEGYEIYDTLSVSPDGSKLVFNMGPFPLQLGEGSIHLYIMNMDGSDLRQLTSSDTDERTAAWSPDGKQIIVQKGTREYMAEPRKLFVIPANAESIDPVNPIRMWNKLGSSGGYLQPNITPKNQKPEWREW